jgi:RND family efflux transporter MFP subunit
MIMRVTRQFLALLALAASGCGSPATETPARQPARADSSTYTVRDTVIRATFTGAGVATASEQAVLSTRLTGTITAVLVQEGAQVRRGELLARIDARDLAARRDQVQAGVITARSLLQDARTQADRFRALHADSAATRYQLEQAELGLARAEAAMQSAEAAEVELTATATYAEIRAPFPGTVTRRWVDPGAFAAPGMPLLEVQNGTQLRISVTGPTRSARLLQRGQRLPARIDGETVDATVEGVVPAAGGGFVTINAIVANPESRFQPGSSAELDVPDGERRALLVPTRALVHQGDLTGVRISGPTGPELRWLQVVRTANPEWSEVTSGLLAGDIILARGE